MRTRVCVCVQLTCVRARQIHCGRQMQETTSHFSQTKYVSLCQSGADGGRRSSPAANAVLVIRRGAPQVMEADPGLEHESINTDCDEQDN